MILRPWRKTRNYGFWLLGLTALLVVLFDFALEPYATQVKHFWRWEPTKAVVYWYATPWVNFLGWAVTALIMLAFVTPSLISKKPTKEPPQRQPLFMWLLFQTQFATGAVAHELWAAAGVIVVLSVVIALVAWRGATW